MMLMMLMMLMMMMLMMTMMVMLIPLGNYSNVNTSRCNQIIWIATLGFHGMVQIPAKSN
jgi:hypothetical protein